MNKADFVNAVAAKLGGNKSDAAKAVDAVLDTISETLTTGGDIKFPGFGQFKTTQRSQKEGRNLRTGEKLVVPAATVPKFVPGKTLKDAVNVKVPA